MYKEEEIKKRKREKRGRDIKIRNKNKEIKRYKAEIKDIIYKSIGLKSGIIFLCPDFRPMLNEYCVRTAPSHF